jgi:outer membrane protein OmpA-like peptidoglycan-associated protein
MNRTVTFVFALVLGIIGCSASIAADRDVKGSRDHPLLSRMTGFYIAEYTEKDYDTYSFLDKSGKKTPIEGHFYYLRYNVDQGVENPGELKIRRNIQEAVKKIGGTVLFDDNFNKVSTMVLKKDGKESWIEVRSFPSFYRLWIVERKTMEQEVVANADAMGNDINATGHVPVYGIYFDTGLAVIKPESDAAIGEIAKLLAADPGLKLHVVGHTDNVGSLDSNMKLSRDRADAVVKALVGKHGVAASRLRAHGVASLSPVASNDSGEGRAKNRRVELVKQ